MNWLVKLSVGIRFAVLFVAIAMLTAMANSEFHLNVIGTPHHWHVAIGEMCGNGGTYAADPDGGLWCAGQGQ